MQLDIETSETAQHYELNIYPVPPARGGQMGFAGFVGAVFVQVEFSLGEESGAPLSDRNSLRPYNPWATSRSGKTMLDTGRAMSQENVEVVERAYAHFERGNFWPTDVFDPHVRVVWANDLITGGRESVGVEQFAEDAKEWLGPWEGATVTAERIIDVGDQVVAIAVWRARGTASDVVAEWRQGHVWTMRGGKVVRLVGYGDPTEALEAAGLRE